MPAAHRPTEPREQKSIIGGVPLVEIAFFLWEKGFFYVTFLVF